MVEVRDRDTDLRPLQMDLYRDVLEQSTKDYRIITPNVDDARALKAKL
jgi:hypothetical protein